MALVLGDAKRAKPKPRVIRPTVMNPRLVFSLIEIKRASPNVVSAIPIEASIRGSNRSESRPATVEKIACTTGMVTKIKPAF